MSFNTNAGKMSFTATAAQTDFTFNFKIYETTDIKVYLTPVGQDPDDAADILVITTDYTVAIDGDNGGTISLVSGATEDDTVVINRDLPATRDISYVTQGDLLADTLNEDQDYQTYLILDGFTALENSTMQLPTTVIGVSNIMPVPVAGLFIKWNATGDALINSVSVNDPDTNWSIFTKRMGNLNTVPGSNVAADTWLLDHFSQTSSYAFTVDADANVLYKVAIHGYIRIEAASGGGAPANGNFTLSARVVRDSDDEVMGTAKIVGTGGYDYEVTFEREVTSIVGGVEIYYLDFASSTIITTADRMVIVSFNTIATRLDY